MSWVNCFMFFNANIITLHHSVNLLHVWEEPNFGQAGLNLGFWSHISCVSLEVDLWEVTSVCHQTVDMQLSCTNQSSGQTSNLWHCWSFYWSSLPTWERHCPRQVLHVFSQDRIITHALGRNHDMSEQRDDRFCRCLLYVYCYCVFPLVVLLTWYLLVVIG